MARTTFFFLLIAGLADAQARPLPTFSAEAIGAGTSRPRQDAANQHAPVVVALVVDQLAAWVLRERIDSLPSEGGFARLRREGMYFQEMAYHHAVTETAPGHASLFTGVAPREHGIVANDLYGEIRESGELVSKKHSILRDEKTAMTTVDGCELADPGPSLKNLGGEGMGSKELKARLVASVFRRQYPEGFVAALSLKDRGALFAAGENPDLAIWFVEKTQATADSPACASAKRHGAFVSWKQAAPRLRALGAFVRSYAANAATDDRDSIQRLLERPWLEPTSDFAGSDYAGFLDAAHVAAAAAKPGAAFRALPATDRMLLDTAAWIVRHEAGDRPTFLSISLSANDYIGHLFGPDSWEARDELRELDRALAAFFDQLDALAPGRWSLVLTADHGIVPADNDLDRPACDRNLRHALSAAAPCRGHRMFAEEIQEAADAAFKRFVPDWPKENRAVAALVEPYIYLTAKARDGLSDNRRRAELTKALDRALTSRFAGIHSILDAKVAGKCPSPESARYDSIHALVCNSMHPGQGGDFYVVVNPGSFFDPELAKGTGTSHGSPYGYDRFVPLLVRDASRPDYKGITQTQVPYTRFRDELVEIIKASASPPGHR